LYERDDGGCAVENFLNGLDKAPRAEESRTMKKPTGWDLYFRKQLADPEMRGLIEQEIESLRVGTQIARMRQKKRLSQAQLAARAGMSAPNISRIENSPAQNMTLETLVKIARALGRGVEVTFPARRS
jgi:DNA-binding Xre family transcriptional regulator